MSGVFAAGLILLAAAAAGDLLGLPHPGRGWASGLPYLLGAAGCGCLAAVGGAALAGGTVRLGVGGLLGQAIPGQQTLGLAADRLSGCSWSWRWVRPSPCRWPSPAGRRAPVPSAGRGSPRATRSRSDRSR